MNKNFIMTLLILLIMVNGWALYFFELPFYQEILISVAFAMLIMTMINERLVFLFSVSFILIYGLFLVIYTLVNNQSSMVQQLFYVYSHILFTSFILLFWMLLNIIKNIGYENTSLKQQIKLLQRYNTKTHLLTLQEFRERSKWAINAALRNNKSACLVTLKMSELSSNIQVNVQETVEILSLNSIRSQFDLITSEHGQIYILLQDADDKGADIVLNRINKKLKERLNLINEPFESKKIIIKSISDLEQVMEVTN